MKTDKHIKNGPSGFEIEESMGPKRKKPSTIKKADDERETALWP